MSTGSPTAYLLWAILAVMFQIFLLVHLWCYDKFKCVLWNSGRQPGAFKRVMTYCYLATIPALVFFGVAMTDLKFKEGYMVYGQDIIPKPYELWRPEHRHWVLPLFFVFSGAWALEIVTHLEELSFWIFLLRQGPARRDWFTSSEFRAWYLGSVAAIIGLPLVTLVSRTNLETCEAWIFLVGSCASTATTIVFLYVLWLFPGFLRHIKSQGAEIEVVVRLATFYQLNLIRVWFRFVFTLPLLIVAIDGVQGSHPILMNPFSSDFLLMLAAIGCFVSSAITLLIFFPRSLAKEEHYSPLPRSSEHAVSSKIVGGHRCPRCRSRAFTAPVPAPLSESHAPSTTGSYFPFPNPEPYSPGSEILLDAPSLYRSRTRDRRKDRDDDTGVEVQTLEVGPREVITRPPPSYRRHSSVMLTISRRPSQQDIQTNQSNLHPYVTTFTSPIDLPDVDVPDDDLPRAI
ncbi:hypothetical protein NEOLEDRAFT_1240446 [Neolentinus lepideus HHB14362 ss-1]|uniref:Uncharacterized protein n=1 Tax=Neolentinus lepideus HHB14362 ss-1 TaxID=1314782 RepID=A0A165TT83_9AGAM|nr:hypothetical protein NEOLEDRAFT_1240446 [Neolentinus lepideus HHB14362 ss-1]